MKYLFNHSAGCGLKHIYQKNYNFFRRAYSFIELQIAMVILAIGLLSFAGLYRVYSRQTDYIEPNNMSSPTYYIVSQSNSWMRKLGAPAQMELTAGLSAWTPLVTEGDRTRQVTLSEDPNENFSLNQMAVNVTVGAP
jgi:hypothetical protein